MRKLFLFLIITSSVYSCKSGKSYTSENTNTHKTEVSAKAKNIVNSAKTFKGVPYQYGGSSKKGMDCSGLIYTAFKEENVLIPRTTSELLKKSKTISLKRVKVGDLLFFKTEKKQVKINHVGLVVDVNRNSIKFIHSTSSKGVIISSLGEKYWNKAFVSARSILN